MTGKNNTLGWGTVQRRALCLLAPGMLGLGLLALGGGCAGKKEQGEIIPAVQSEGNLNPPVVISSKPARDTRALAQADEQLNEADWKVLEKLGPRPIWQQVDKKSRRSRSGAS